MADSLGQGSEIECSDFFSEAVACSQLEDRTTGVLSAVHFRNGLPATEQGHDATDKKRLQSAAESSRHRHPKSRPQSGKIVAGVHFGGQS